MRLLLFVVSVALLGCAGASSTPAPCICNKNYEPVCGTDGITYGNPCQLDCSGVALDHHGRCQTPCVCPRNWDPHCGLDGVTYANLCMLDCSGTILLHDGPCAVAARAARAAPVCPCPFIYLPVCGDDGITYGNQCALECGHTVHKVSDGPCPPTETTPTP